MKKFFLLFALCCLTATTINAQYSLTVADPNRTFYQTQGIITEPVVEITPNGAYAQVDMTFKINADPSYSSSLQLESVLLFDLPKGSYIHDSWLWLDETNIIKADVVEKNRAITIYEGIVNRRRDPSLLIKTGENSYKLNVYPLRTDYARKVKLSYSVPLSWRNNQMIVELPVDIFRTSEKLPDIPFKINHDSRYTSPDLIEESYNKYLLSASSSQDVLMFYHQQYDNANNYNISFTPSNPNAVTLNTFPINANEGVYQLTIPPSALSVNSVRNTAIIIDHQPGSYCMYSIDQIKQYIKSALLTNYNSTDNFNIFFSTASNVTQVFSTWQPIEKYQVDSAINAIPNNLSSSKTQHLELLKKALAFCGATPGNETQAILFSSDYSYTNDQKATDKLFDDVKQHIGAYNNKINVINYSTYKRTIFGGTHNANDILYSKLTLAAGGSLFKYSKYTSSYINKKYVYTYDLNPENALREIASNSGISTNSYNINIGVSNGFTYSEYNVYNKTKFNASNHFIETGKYTGTIPNGATVSVQVNLPTGNISQQFIMTMVGAGNPTYKQSWAHKYIEDLLQLNNQAYTQEIIDSSINNRVLCDLTAFLAVETGDTIATNVDENPNLVSVKDATLKDGTGIKCYPNPFSGALTIEVPKGTNTLEIFDLMGRKVFAININEGQTHVKWNGKDNQGNELPNGMYVVVAQAEDIRHTTKVMKQ